MSRSSKSQPRKEDDDMCSQVPSQSLSEEEFRHLVQDTVLFIISQARTKHPIKRQDISKNILRNHSRHFRKVIQEVQNVLLQVYGVQLIGLEDGGKSYLAINTLENSTEKPHILGLEEEKSKDVLLILILSFIFMSGKAVKEDQLISFLTQLQITSENNSVHKYFGDVKAIIKQEFVRQMYLEYSRVPDTDPPKFEYRWGKRAEKEISLNKVLEFVCKIYGNCKPSDWVSQYSEAQKNARQSSSNSNNA